jgi:hypothetical protein
MEKIIKRWKESNLHNYKKKFPKNTILEHQLTTIEQWLRSPDAARHRKRLSRLSIPDALKLSQKWESKQLFCKIPQLNDTGSSLIKKYPDGFSWVKLNTDESFYYEGHLMRHCIYDHRKRTDCLIFSLRNPNNYPICTVELSRNGTINQFKGKYNHPVDESYHPYLIDFFIENPIMKINKTSEDILYVGYCFIQGNTYKLTELPAHSTINHNVKLFNNDIKKLNCNKLIIFGDLQLKELNELEELPEHLVVYGDIYISSCTKLKKLPRILQASGSITIDLCPQLKEFPFFMKTKQFQVTNCGFLNWKNIKNIIIDSHVSCFNSQLNKDFLNKFKLTNDTGTWQTYQLKLVNRYIELVKYIVNSSKKIFDLFGTKI